MALWAKRSPFEQADCVLIWQVLHVFFYLKEHSVAENYEIRRKKVFHRKKNTTSIVKRGAREIRKCHNSQFGSWLVASETRFKKVPRSGGRTRDLFDFRLFSLTSSTLDHSATAPPNLRNQISTVQIPSPPKFISAFVNSSAMKMGERRKNSRDRSKLNPG